MNGATQVFFIGVAYGQLLSGVGGSGGGDDPRHPWQHPMSVHEADNATTPAGAQQRKMIKKQPGGARKGGGEESNAYSCPVCERRFKTEKAVHGHMRTHPDRAWRGMEEPRPTAADDEQKEYRYACERCGAQFETRQALGGHRASHSGRVGCFSLSRQATEPRPPVLPFDLNDPAPEQEEEEDY